MGYELGVDLGTTYTAAATHRVGRAQIVELGNRSATIPSVIFLTENDEILTGEAANRRAASDPSRVAREFKRRIGDPTPVLIGGSPYSAESLSARLLDWVIRKVSENEGEPAARVAVTHPANWGPYKLDLLHQAFRMADLDQVVTLTEPEAAAIHYSTLERIEPGMSVAVFDLGGGTFDAAILRKKAEGFNFLGDPEGIERLGGIDFDAAVFAFVKDAIGEAMDTLDDSDPSVLAAVARLRRDCVDAKEALSSDTEVNVPVVLPGVHTDIRLTRVEFEQMIRPSLVDSIGAMKRAIRSASLTVEEIDLILLVGGSSRIPLVSQLVGGELGRPVAVDVHPKHSVALGAARAAANSGAAHLASVTMAAPLTQPPSTPGPGLPVAGAAAAAVGSVANPSPGPTPSSTPPGMPPTPGRAEPVIPAAGTAQPPGQPPIPTGPAAPPSTPAGTAMPPPSTGAGPAMPLSQTPEPSGADPTTGLPPAAFDPSKTAAVPTGAAVPAGLGAPTPNPSTAPPNIPAGGPPPDTSAPSTPPTTAAPDTSAPSVAPTAGTAADTSAPSASPTTAAPDTSAPSASVAGGAAAGAAALAGRATMSASDPAAFSANPGRSRPTSDVPLASTGTPAPKRSKVPVFVGVAAVVLLAVAGVVAATQLGAGDGDDVTAGLADSGAVDDQDDDAADDGDDPQDSTTTTADDATTTGEVTSTTAVSTTSTTEAPFVCDGLCAHPGEVTIEDDGELVIEWEAFNYEPSISNFHAHFFYDIYEPEQVGSNNAQYGVTRGDWHLTDENPFSTRGTNVAVANAPAGTEQICVVAADSGHGVINPENAECFDIR